MRDEIMQAIKTSLENKVNLGKMNITDDEIAEIMHEIKQSHPGVTSIYLHRNNISDKGALILGKECKSLKNLLHLDLQYNDIDEEGATAIVALKLNHPKITIGLHGNKITNAADMMAIEKKSLRPK